MPVDFVFFIIHILFPQAVIFTQLLEWALLLYGPEVNVHPYNTSIHSTTDTTLHNGSLAAVSKILHTWEMLSGNLVVYSVWPITAVSLLRGGWGHFTP
jgi:hypothetical protein